MTLLADSGQTIMATNDSFDDVFDEDGSENLLQQRDWYKMQAHLFKENFRVGVLEGEERSIERGFNCGYQQAVGLYHGLGSVRGQVRALLEVTAISLRETTRAELESIQQEVTHFEDELKKSVKTKCTDLVDVQPGPSRDVSVCSCEGQKICPFCYSGSRAIASDLGLEDIVGNPHSDCEARVPAGGDGVTSDLSLQHISASYAELLDQATAKIAEFENRVAQIVKDSKERHN